jgi:hypothetical protein
MVWTFNESMGKVLGRSIYVSDLCYGGARFDLQLSH